MKTIKTKKMKTTISKQSGDILEIAKQVIYSAKVLAIGLFIPFLFVFGISYHTDNKVAQDEINISKQHQVITENNDTVDFAKFLSMI
jgi:cell division protein FtsL